MARFHLEMPFNRPDTTGREFDTSPRIGTTAPRQIAAAAPVVAVAVCATFFTYLYYGYRHGVWPQLALLESVYALHGELRSDWFTSLPPVHWVLAHALAQLPIGALRPALFALWAIGVTTLWGSVAILCRLLGAGVLAGLGVAMLALPTALDGVGLSSALLGMMYPTTLAFGIGFAGLSALALGRALVAGLLIGLATAVHPNVGVLFALVIAPGVLVLPHRLRAAVRFGAGFAVLGAFPLVHVVLDKALSNSLPQRQAFDLMVVVRNPHHALYRVFPKPEYVHTVAWLVVFVLALPLIGSGIARRVMIATVASTVALAVLGGVASELRHPFALVELLTSRVTPLIVLLGIVAGIAGLTRAWGAFGVVAAGVGFETAHLVAPIGNFDSSAVEAVVVGVAVIAAHLGLRYSARPGRRYPWRPSARLLDIAGVAAAVAFLLLAAAIVVRARAWVIGVSAQDVAWRQVATETRARTPVGSVVLTPPDLDGFRYYARRAIVVDYGEFPFGRGTRTWSNRLVAVTGDPAIMTSELPPDDAIRSARMARDYDRETARTSRAACRYNVRFVVTRASAARAGWLVELFKNDFFVLSRVKQGACHPT